jgi:hypothetical protein
VITGTTVAPAPAGPPAATPASQPAAQPAATPAKVTAQRPTVERLRSAFATSEIQLKFHPKQADKNVNSGSFVFDAATGKFVQSQARALHPLAPASAAYQLLDADGALFAYIDSKGGLWIVDDLLENAGGRADDEADDWTFVTDYHAAY